MSDEIRMVDFARAARMAAASVSGNGDGIRQVIAEACGAADPEQAMGGLLAALSAGYAAATAAVYGEDRAELVLLSVADAATSNDD